MKVHEYTVHCTHPGCAAHHTYTVHDPEGAEPIAASYHARVTALASGGWSQGETPEDAQESWLAPLLCPAHTQPRNGLVLEFRVQGVEHMTPGMNLADGRTISRLPVRRSDTATVRSLIGKRVRVTIEVIE